MAEDGSAEDGMAEDGMAEVGSSEVGSSEVGSSKVSMAEVGTAEIRPYLWMLLSPCIPSVYTLIRVYRSVLDLPCRFSYECLSL